MAEKPKNENYPAVQLVRKDPRTAAMLSKTVANNRVTPARDESGNRKTLLPQSYTFQNKLKRRAKKNSDAKMILKLLPDLELGIQILTSSIQSPADMMSTELNYTGPQNTVLPADLSGSLLNRVKEYFEEDYKIKPLIPKMLRDILAEKGSYPVAVIPENVIDEFINGDRFISMEALKQFVNDKGEPRNLGILGSPTQNNKSKIKGLAIENFQSIQKADEIDSRLHIAQESSNQKTTYYTDDNTHVTDNIMVLKFPHLNSKLRKKAIHETITKLTGGFSLESHKEMTDLTIEKLIYRPRSFQAEQVAVFKKQNELKRASVGNPLIMKLPSEAVIPVHVPGNVEQQIGYFVLLDEEGNPIESTDDDFYYAAMGKNFSDSRGSLGSNIIQKINSNIGGSMVFDPSNVQYMDYAAQIYGDMVERDLIARIKNGVHSTNVQIARNEEIYRIMLSRTLSRKYTQLLYIPIDYMTYMAFKYSDDGIGKSLLDDSSTINTLRSVMVFADVIASIKNSIGRTQVEMTLPENDPNPMKTIEMAQEEIVRSRQLGIPLGVTNPSDITEFIQRAGYEWSFTGHPGLPDLKFTFNNTNSSYTKPDSELMDYLRKSSIMSLGLSPETVDNGFNTEFATTAIANNILLSKRILQYQELFNPALTDHLRKVAAHSEKLVTDLKDMLEENYSKIKIDFTDDEKEALKELPEEFKKKYIINQCLYEFLNQFEVTLPQPPSITLENQVEELNTYMEALDKGIDAYISETFITETTGGELSGKIDVIKGMVKAYYLRRWMADKGVLTELSELTATSENGQPQLNLLSETTDHIKSLVRSCINAIAEVVPVANAATSDLGKLGVDAGDEGFSSDTSSSTSDSDSFGGDLDFSEDLTGDDLSSEEPAGNTDTTETEPTEETPPKEEPNPDEEDEPKPTL